MSDEKNQSKTEEKQDKDVENAPKSNAMAAFSPQINELKDALALLYIRKNTSGRNKFRDKWPDVADYIFGETLIQYDNDGTQDWDHRAKLEEEAGQRRVLLKETIVEIVDKSVEAGQLNFDYVGKVIDTFGGQMAHFLYAKDVIERVRPGLLASVTATEPAENKHDTPVENAPLASATETEVEPPLSEDEKDILSNKPEEPPKEEAPKVETPPVAPPPIKQAEDDAEKPSEKISASKDDPFDSVVPIETQTPSTAETSAPSPEKPEAPVVSEEPKKASAPAVFSATPASKPMEAEKKESAKEKVAPGTYVKLFNSLAAR